VRAVLGQQITVKAATTLAGRFVAAFGEPIETPEAGLTRLSPTPQRIAEATVDEVASLGIIQTRARSIIALAQEVTSGRLRLEPGARPEGMIARLVALPGIGMWTAQYIAMRALRWPDAFPKEDVAMLKQLGGVTAARAEELSRAWRPWRSYAMLHLWQRGAPSASAGSGSVPAGDTTAA
jgi:AraC family transcriptional regulator, regulatory protein of adaptative response / DNA-3-methyladenine glycosylase II